MSPKYSSLEIAPISQRRNYDAKIPYVVAKLLRIFPKIQSFQNRVYSTYMAILIPVITF